MSTATVTTNAAKTAAGNQNKKKVHPHVVHPQEWKVGLICLIIVGVLRFQVFSSPDSFWAKLFGSTSQRHQTRDGLFGGVSTEQDVQNYLEYNYCRLDLQVQCGPGFLVVDHECDWRRIYGAPLDIVVRTGRATKDCSLPTVLNASAVYWPESVFRNGYVSNIAIDPSLTGEDWNSFNQEEQAFIQLTLRVVKNAHGQTSRYFRIVNNKLKPWFPGTQLDRLIRFYLYSLLDFFTSPRPVERGILAQQFSRERVLTLMGFAVKVGIVAWTSNGSIERKHFMMSFLAKVDNVLNLIKEETNRPNPLISLDADESELADDHPVRKHEYALFGTAVTTDCMYQCYEKKTLISDRCVQAIEEAPHKVMEVEIESGGEFLFITHVGILSIQVACCVSLITMFGAKKRLEKKLDKGRRRLEQELTDPFLRESLERKAAQLPDEGQRQQLIAKLEERLVNWDSKGAAQDLFNKHLRRFRQIIVGSIVAATVIYGLLLLIDASSIPRYLETVFFSGLLFVLSYAVPSLDGKKEGDTTSELMMNRLDDVSSSQALLSDPELLVDDVTK